MARFVSHRVCVFCQRASWAALTTITPRSADALKGVKNHTRAMAAIKHSVSYSFFFFFKLGHCIISLVMMKQARWGGVATISGCANSDCSA